MSTPTATQPWVHLECKPGSAYRQLFVKGKSYMAARTIHDMVRDPDAPFSPESVASAYDVPVEAVYEAIAYCESNPPEIRQDREMDDARIWARLQAACHATMCSAPVGQPWTYLDRKPGSLYRQLVIKGRNVRARTLYGMYMSETGPHTLEEIAEDYQLPLEAVLEAMAYCSVDPPEIREEWERDQASIEAGNYARRDQPRPAPDQAQSPQG